MGLFNNPFECLFFLDTAVHWVSEMSQEKFPSGRDQCEKLALDARGLSKKGAERKVAPQEVSSGKVMVSDGQTNGLGEKVQQCKGLGAY